MFPAELFVALHCTFLSTGLSGNAFILRVHFLDWLKTRMYNPCNMIISSIGTTNIFLQGVVVIQQISYFEFLGFYLQISSVLVPAIGSLSLCSLWCATCLCFYYCVKVVAFNGPFFSRLKAKLPVVVPWLIGISLLLSCSVGVIAYWNLYINVYFSTVNITGNEKISTSYSFGSKCNCMLEICLSLASLAFAIILLTGGTLITSLCKHMSRMRQSNEASGQSRIQTHLSAVKTVISLLVVYLIFYTSFSLLTNSTTADDINIAITCLVVISSFPTMNSIILILGNRKLINALKKVLGIKSRVGNSEVTVATNDY